MIDLDNSFYYYRIEIDIDLNKKLISFYYNIDSKLILGI